MKIRQGFVSNSSSSSFTCSYCEANISGMDMYPAISCSNDHDFCEYCSYKIKLSEPTHEEMVAYVAKHSSWSEGEDTTDEGFVKDIYEDVLSDYGFDTSVCPCCNLEVIPRSDLLPFLLKHYNLTIEQVKEMMRNESA